MNCHHNSSHASWKASQDAKMTDSGDSRNLIGEWKRYGVRMCDVTTKASRMIAMMLELRYTVSHYFALYYNVFRRQLTSWDRCCLRKFPVGTPSNRQRHDDGNLLFVVQHDNIRLESSVNKRWRRQDLWRPRPSNNQPALSFPKAANVALDSRNEDLELDAAWKQETRQLSTQIGSPIASRSTEGKAYNNQPVLGEISKIELFQIQRNNIQRSGFLEWWVHFLLPSRVKHFYFVRRCLQATMYTRY